jgi:hypothetical protein
MGSTTRVRGGNVAGGRTIRTRREYKKIYISGV